MSEIDVSRCKFYEVTNCCYDDGLNFLIGNRGACKIKTVYNYGEFGGYGICSGDCYYKQLQEAKEEKQQIEKLCKKHLAETINQIKEIEKLQQELQLEKDNVAELNELLIAEKEENEELKTHYEQQLKAMIDNFNEQKQKYDNEYMEYSKELGRIRQKIEKIKEIVSENCKLCFDVDGFKKYDDCGICEAKNILQIIESEE